MEIVVLKCFPVQSILLFVSSKNIFEMDFSMIYTYLLSMDVPMPKTDNLEVFLGKMGVELSGLSGEWVTKWQ